MIAITERWSVFHDSYQWVLVESCPGKDKKGNPKTQTKETYHPWLEQAMRWAAERNCGDATAFRDVQAAYMGLVHALADHTRPLDRRATEALYELRETKARLSDALSEAKRLREKNRQLIKQHSEIVNQLGDAG